MTNRSGTEEVGFFWDRVSKDYNRSAREGENHHQVSARLLNNALKGRVLCPGGLWVGADAARHDLDITVLDLSPEMAKYFRKQGAQAVVGDARQMPFANNSFDHVVFPLILHHITGKNGRTARQAVRRALQEAARVLSPGGRLWVKEITVPRGVYLSEVALAPLTRVVLNVARVPLVIFHSSSFLKSAIVQAGFSQPSVIDCTLPSSWLKLVRPVIGLPRLLVPEALLPVSYQLFSSRLTEVGPQWSRSGEVD